MRRHKKLAGLVVGIALGSMALTAATTVGSVWFHERKEVAGLAVVFGVEPEPALTEEMQALRWRVSSLAEETPYTEMKHARVVITRDGEEFGPFSVRAVRGNAGQYQTRRIFTQPGEYESVLSFQKGEEETVHTVDFDFRITDRTDLEIPRRRGGG
jgi:hypothetical protein